jgi:DNA-binding transcriptional regulator YbjK
MTSRRELILDAAIRVLAGGGPRALTHRAVDAAAGLPAGSTSNHFRSRDALLSALVDRVAEVETGAWGALAASRTVDTPDALALLLTDLVALVTGPAREVTTARYALFAEAPRHEELRHRIAGASASIAAAGTHWLASLGSAKPEAHAAILLAYLDGVILHQLAAPEPETVLRARLETLLAALLPERGRPR